MILGINSFVIGVIQLRVIDISNWSDTVQEFAGSNKLNFPRDCCFDKLYSSRQPQNSEAFPASKSSTCRSTVYNLAPFESGFRCFNLQPSFGQACQTLGRFITIQNTRNIQYPWQSIGSSHTHTHARGGMSQSSNLKHDPPSLGPRHRGFRPVGLFQKEHKQDQIGSRSLWPCCGPAEAAAWFIQKLSLGHLRLMFCSLLHICIPSDNYHSSSSP